MLPSSDLISGATITANPIRDVVSGDPARPVVAVLAITRREGQVILVRRANAPDAGLWGFPGGKIEHGETMFLAAERELREETGVDSRAMEILSALDAIGPGDHHFVLIAVLCRWVTHEPVASDDALEARWFGLDDLGAITATASQGVIDLAASTIERRLPSHEQSGEDLR